MSIKLTIGLSFYNNESTLTTAIKSILMQSYSSWELILMDDGSTDNSVDIALNLTKGDSRVKVISDGNNKGLVYRLNQIIDLAKGDYIARMDSDDIMLPDRLEKQMKLLLLDLTVDVIDSSIFVIDDYDEPYGFRAKPLEQYSLRAAVKGSILYHPTVIAKSSWYRQNKYSEGYLRSEDHELWCRSTNATKFMRINQPLLLYREGKINIQNYSQSMVSTRKILRKYGPNVLSPIELIIELLNTRIKNAAYRLAGLFGWQRLLSSTRNKALSKKDKNYIKKIIIDIKSFDTATYLER